MRLLFLILTLSLAMPAAAEEKILRVNSEQPTQQLAGFDRELTKRSRR